jgi:two-component system chemotaxis response regulator CheY
MKSINELHILLIDDSAMTRMVVGQMLVNFGVRQIYEAPDGMTGLHMLESYCPDIILCDLSMEPVDGFEFVQILRSHKNEAARHVPVIILTVHDEETFVNKAGAMEIDGYLLKPIAPDILEKRICQVLSRAKHEPVAEQPLFG